MDIARNLVDAARNLTTSTARPRARLPPAHRRARPRRHPPHRARPAARRARRPRRHAVAQARRGRARDAQAHQAPARVRAPGARRDRRARPTSARTPPCAWPARRISAPRDAQVLLETLDALTERFADELADGRDRAPARPARGGAHGRDGRPATATSNGAIAATRATLDDVARPHAHLDLRARRLRRPLPRPAADLPPRPPRDARRAQGPDRREPARVAQAREGPLARDGDRRAPPGPRRLERVARRAHKLSSLLGDHHDLHVLRAYVETHPQCFAEEVQPAGAARRDRPALAAAVREGARPRPQALQAQAQALRARDRARLAQARRRRAEAAPPAESRGVLRLASTAWTQHARPPTARSPRAPRAR